YVINTFSFLAAYKLELKFKDGQLVAIGNKQDSTGVASQLITAVGEVEAARLQAEAQKQSRNGKLEKGKGTQERGSRNQGSGKQDKGSEDQNQGSSKQDKGSGTQNQGSSKQDKGGEDQNQGSSKQDKGGGDQTGNHNASGDNTAGKRSLVPGAVAGPMLF